MNAALLATAKLRSVPASASAARATAEVVTAVAVSSDDEQADATAERERNAIIVQQHFLCNMDRWVHKLQPEETIRTLTLSLSRADRDALMLLGTGTASDSQSEPATAADESHRAAAERVLADIAQRLDALIASFDARERGCFIKLSSRSAKDSAMACDATFSFYRDLCAAASPPPADCNARLILLYEAMGRAMRPHVAREALDLMLQSRRIAWDLKFDADFPDANAAEPLHIVAREWLPIPLRGEFRVFVYDNCITAISQYFSQLYFGEQLNDAHVKAALESGMRAFWERLKPHFMYIENQPDPLLEPTRRTPIVKYIIDLAFVEDDNPRWVVLELNPFNISTAACLFSWEDDTDSDILTGRRPFEFRVLAKPVAHTLQNKLHPQWVPLVFGE